jgi:hypothetical protein
MTVQELINELTSLCEGRDPSTVEIKKVIPAEPGDMWGDDWDDFYLDTAGGNDYPFVILLK